MTTLALGPNGNRVYPWEQWQDGKPHRATKGKNFAISPEAFRRSLHTRATRTGLSVTCRVKGDVVHFQFSPK